MFLKNKKDMPSSWKYFKSVWYQGIYTTNFIILATTVPENDKKCMRNYNSLKRICLPLQSIRFARRLPPFLCARLGYAAPSWATPPSHSSTWCNPACRRPIRFIVLLVFVSFSFFANPIGREHAQTFSPSHHPHPPLLFNKIASAKLPPLRSCSARHCARPSLLVLLLLLVRVLVLILMLVCRFLHRTDSIVA